MAMVNKLTQRRFPLLTPQWHASMHRGLTLTDVLSSVVVVALIACVLVVSSGRQRAIGSQSESLSNLRQIGTITASYGADHQNRMWGFSWRPDVPVVSQWADIRFHAGQDALTAAAAQAVDLIRRRTNDPTFPIPSNWAPHIFYSHLVLADYFNAGLPMSPFVAPGDRNRRRWSENIAAFRANQLMPQPDASDPVNWRWPYGSSYELSVGFFAPDARTSTTGTITQATAHNQFVLVPSLDGSRPELGGRLLTEVRYPSDKVLMYESAQWQGARSGVYFMFEHARIPLLLVDGSAAVRVTSDTNPGWNPEHPTSLPPMTTSYMPSAWEAPAAVSGASVVVHYRFTRWGLRGRDVNGQEVTGP
jgi:hypothetical protein